MYYGVCPHCGAHGLTANHQCRTRTHAVKDENSCTFFNGYENERCDAGVVYNSFPGNVNLPCPGAIEGLVCQDAEYSESEEVG